jgi:hypothetical protein
MAAKRPVVVAVRLSEAEAQAVDAARGGLSRSAWLRMMLVDYRKKLSPGLRQNTNV